MSRESKEGTALAQDGQKSAAQSRNSRGGRRKKKITQNLRKKAAKHQRDQ